MRRMIFRSTPLKIAGPAAVALVLLVLGIVSVAGARAAGSRHPGGSLTQQFPLGTQTLCCTTSPQTSSSTTTSTARQSAPSTTTGAAAAPASARTVSTANPAPGHGGVPILLVAAVAGGVLVLASLGFGFRVALSPGSTHPRDQSARGTSRLADSPRGSPTTMARLRQLRDFLERAREDPLSRTSAMLITDNLALSLVGAICSVIMTQLWSAPDVGAVASITGAVNILVVASVLGMPTTITRFMGREPRQRRLLQQAMLMTSAIAGVAAVAMALIPGHLGVPLDDLDLRPTLLTALMVLYALVTVVVTVGDPSYVARQEVSFLLGKDLFASTIRIVLILLVSHTHAQTLFLAVFGYSAVAGGVDLVILSRRLKDEPAAASTSDGWLQPLRSRFSFAIGIHVALVASSIPVYLLPAVTNALSSSANSAYAAIALQVGAVLTLVPTQVGQSLLSDLSQRPDRLAQSTLRALRGAYVTTLPIAFVVGVFAPYVLLIFGSKYSHHGTSFLRWSAAGSVFFVFNYIADVVLLARHLVRQYIFVNVMGTAVFMVLIVLALTTSFRLLGPAWLVGQAAYATMSLAIVLRYISPDQRRALRHELAHMRPGRPH